MTVHRPGPEHIGTTGASAGDFLGYDPDTDEYLPMAPPSASGITGLTSDDSSVTITDNGDGTLDLAATGGGGGGTGCGVLASSSYNPATLLSASATTTIADVDAANMAVTFTAPASGIVMLSLSALFTTSTSSSAAVFWHVRSGATTLVSRHLGSAGSQQSMCGAVTFKITGLTPGTSYTLKWAHSTGAGTGATYAGGVAGPAVMEVRAHP